MLGWINKKLKMVLFKDALAQNGAPERYPDTLLREIVDATFEMTKGLSQVSLSGAGFDFDANWNFYLSPYIKLLSANAAMATMRRGMTDEQLCEAFAISMAGANQFGDVTRMTAHHVNDLLERHGLESHLSAIDPMLID